MAKEVPQNHFGGNVPRTHGFLWEGAAQAIGGAGASRKRPGNKHRDQGTPIRPWRPGTGLRSGVPHRAGWGPTPTATQSDLPKDLRTQERRGC